MCRRKVYKNMALNGVDKTASLPHVFPNLVFRTIMIFHVFIGPIKMTDVSWHGLMGTPPIHIWITFSTILHRNVVSVCMHYSAGSKTIAIRGWKSDTSCAFDNRMPHSLITVGKPCQYLNIFIVLALAHINVTSHLEAVSRSLNSMPWGGKQSECVETT